MVGACVAACQPSDEAVIAGDRLWESAHFRYHSREDDDGTCPKVLEYLERHFDVMHDYLRLQRPAGLKIDYFKFVDVSDYTAHADCPIDSDSCTFGSSVMSPHPFQEHELVHAYMAPLGLPPAFFVEGLASAFSCRAQLSVQVNQDWRKLVTLPFSDRSDVYSVGAWYVAYLLERFGAAQFLEFYRLLGKKSDISVPTIAEDFEATFGYSFDDVWQDAKSTTDLVRCVHLWHCNGAPLVLDGTVQTLESACDGSDSTRTFTLEDATDVILSSPGNSYFAPVRCQESADAPRSSAMQSTIVDSTIATLTSGKYFLQATSRRPTHMSVRALSSRGYAAQCPQSVPVDLNAVEFAGSYFELLTPRDEGPTYLRVRPPANRTLWWSLLEESTEVERCQSCSEPMMCAPIGGGAALTPDGDGTVTLKVVPAALNTGYLTLGFLLQ